MIAQLLVNTFQSKLIAVLFSVMNLIVYYHCNAAVKCRTQLPEKCYREIHSDPQQPARTGFFIQPCYCCSYFRACSELVILEY